MKTFIQFKEEEETKIKVNENIYPIQRGGGNYNKG